MLHKYCNILCLSVLIAFTFILPANGAHAQDGALQEQMRQAQELVQQKRYAAATQAFTELLTLGKQRNDIAIEAFALYGRGYCRLELLEYGQAQADLERSLQLYSDVSSPSDQARVLFQLGRLGEAFNLVGGPRLRYLQVLAIARRLGDRRSEAQALMAIGKRLPIVEVIDSEPALMALDATTPRGDEALQLAEAIQRSEGLLSDLAETLAARQNYADNPESLSKLTNAALQIARQSNNPDQIILRLNDSAVLAANEAHIQKALSLANESVTLALSYNDPERLSDALLTTAYIYSQQRQYQDALAYLNRALESAEQSETPQDNIAVTYGLSDTYARIGQHSLAVPALNRLLAMFRERHYALGEGNTLIRLAQAAYGDRQYQQAEQLTNDAIVANGHLTKRAAVLLMLADTRIQQQKYEAAQNPLAEAVTLARSTNNTLLLAEAQLVAARLIAAQTNNAPEVSLIYQRGLELARESGDLSEQYAVLVATGDYYHQRGDIDKALAFYRDAIIVRDTWQRSLGLEAFRRAGADASADLYERIFELTAERDSATAFEMSERARARVLLDQLSGAKLDPRASGDPALVAREQALITNIRSLEGQLETNMGLLNSLEEAQLPSSTPENDEKTRDYLKQQQSRLQTVRDQLRSLLDLAKSDYEQARIKLQLSSPEYVAVTSGQPLLLKDVQALLDPQTTLLTYYTTKSDSYVFVITQQQAQIYPLHIDDLAARIADLREAIRNQDADQELAQLARDLLGPIADQLTTPVVGIVPFGILHELPFSALPYQGQPLGIAKTIFLLPSASVLPYIQGRNQAVLAQPLLMAEGRVRTGWSALAGADQEVIEIGALVHATPLMSSEASVSAFRRHASQASLIHLAMHARLDTATPLFSQLLFAAEESPLDVRELYDMDLRQTSLVVLSACETQLGEGSRGDEITSLNRAFLYAGAASVIASLWKVDDAATRLLMVTFYQALDQGAGKAQALQLAQQRLQQHPEYSDPFYWSGFVLNGDPGAIQPNTALPTAIPQTELPSRSQQAPELQMTPTLSAIPSVQPSGAPLPWLWVAIAVACILVGTILGLRLMMRNKR